MYKDKQSNGFPDVKHTLALAVKGSLSSSADSKDSFLLHQ